MPGWLKNPVEGGQGGSAPLRTSFSDEEKLSSANYLNKKYKFFSRNFIFYLNNYFQTARPKYGKTIFGSVAVLKIRRQMMTVEKAKKRGRPAQLLEIAELRKFVEFLIFGQHRECTELQTQVIEYLKDKDFNFELLSEAQQILVKEALKPYREHTKLVLLAEQLESEKNKSEYEKKFLKLYKDYEYGLLDQEGLNLLKMMCTRYLNFKAQKLDASDLDLYLSQIQKKEAKTKRTAENRRKFEIGGAVLSASKELCISVNYSAEQIKEIFIEKQRYFDRMRSTRFFAEASHLTSNYELEDDVIVRALNNLSKYTHDGKSITTIEIEKAILEVNELRNKKY